MVGDGHERKPLIGMHVTAGAERMFLLRGVEKGGGIVVFVYHICSKAMDTHESNQAAFQLAVRPIS